MGFIICQILIYIWYWYKYIFDNRIFTYMAIEYIYIYIALISSCLAYLYVDMMLCTNRPGCSTPSLYDQHQISPADDPR